METINYISDAIAGLQGALINGWVVENWQVIAILLFIVEIVWGIVVLSNEEPNDSNIGCGIEQGECR